VTDARNFCEGDPPSKIINKDRGGEKRVRKVSTLWKEKRNGKMNGKRYLNKGTRKRERIKFSNDRELRQSNGPPDSKNSRKGLRDESVGLVKTGDKGKVD